MKNKFIYYGILFYFLYNQTYSIISDILILPILSMQGNIHLIPILLSLVIILLSVLFYRITKFPKIRIWLILLVIFLSVVVSFFNIPAKFYLSGINSAYSTEKQSMITNYILTCKVINTIVFLAIAYFKYLTAEKKDKHNSDVDNTLKFEK